MSKVTKLAIGTATNGMIQATTAFSLATAMLNTRVPMQMFLGIGCLIDKNRNTIVTQAIEQGCSHILFVDTDMVFKPEAINQLINHDLDIVGARYNKRIFPIVSTVPNITELSEVPFIPAGFMLVDIEVFKKIGEPYFSFTDTESEDVYFCQKAIKNGYKVMCDPTIEVGHLGTAIF